MVGMWLGKGASTEVGWFHGITGEQGAARRKRGVIGYSEWGSWQAGSSTQCDKSQYYCMAGPGKLDSM
jgi:hypothetical protein